jgi:hypothetical protein
MLVSIDSTTRYQRKPYSENMPLRKPKILTFAADVATSNKPKMYWVPLHF